MNAIEAGLPPVCGTIDRAGRLVDADPRLAALNAGAGGEVGRPLAVPQLATLARLARRLGILIARRVTVADGDDDLELWVRAEPEAGCVRLAITGWTFRGAWLPDRDDRRARDLAATDADLTWETDAALRLTFLDEAAATRLGIDAPALLGQPITRLFALAEAADGGLPILAAVSNQSGFADQRATVRDGGRDVTLDAAPRLDVAGRFAGFIGGARLVEAPAPADAGGVPQSFGVQLDRALRGPLGRIVANADSINGQSDGPLQPEYTGYAADIASAGRHLLGLVDDLIDLQSVERADFTVMREPLDLADLAWRAAGLLAVRADAQEVRIDRPAAGDPLPATGEFRRALQVLVNLLGNAVRYSPPGGMIWIRLQQEGNHAAVIVADQGKGIALADQARIFDKFERVDPSEPGGSGLGLYISRRLARAMGGDIVVDSAPGQGARFVFTLPIR